MYPILLISTELKLSSRVEYLSRAIMCVKSAEGGAASAASAEDEAATELEAAIGAIRPGGEPGSSGVVKAEASPELA